MARGERPRRPRFRASQEQAAPRPVDGGLLLFRAAGPKREARCAPIATLRTQGSRKRLDSPSPTCTVTVAVNKVAFYAKKELDSLCPLAGTQAA